MFDQFRHDMIYQSVISMKTDPEYYLITAIKLESEFQTKTIPILQPAYAIQLLIQWHV